jgi:hypothetical protein
MTMPQRPIIGTQAVPSKEVAPAGARPAQPAAPEWLPLIERFRDGDDTVLPAMQSGKLEWTSIVAERWTARMAEAFKVRLEKVSRQLQTALDRASGDAFTISRAMLAARRALTPLRTAAALPCLTDDVRKHFSGEVARFAAETQQSLESSAKRVRSDGGAMLKSIRDNPLTAEESPVADPEPPSDSSPSSARGRRVLL